MPERILTDVGVWISGLSYAGVSNSVGIELTADTPESTRFKGNAGWRTRAEGGLKSAAFSLGGFFDDRDADQFASLGTERSVMVVSDGMAAGDVAWIIPVAVSGHQLSGSVGDLLAFTYAAEGDGAAVRAQVLDIRENLRSPTTITRRQLGAIPVGENLHVWAHITRLDGALRIDLRSSASSGGAATVRASEIGITDTGLYILSVPGPVTHQWWELVYMPTGASPDFDVAAASFFAAQQAIVIPPPPINPPIMGSVTLKGGLSADAIPVAAELTIDGVQHELTFQPFASMHVLIWRIATQPDITSIVDAADTTNQNQIAQFTKYGSTVDVGGDTGNVWVSNQELTFSSARTMQVQ